VRNPIAVMMREHEDAGEALAQMRELTGGYVPPTDACNTYRVMLAGLLELEQDMHVHVHKENHILFPKAAAMEGLNEA
jgi:regulator of cell morphogenesis and NO signaling